MGGNIPLGYDVRDRKLVVNTEEADTVVDIFTVSAVPVPLMFSALAD